MVFLLLNGGLAIAGDLTCNGKKSGTKPIKPILSHHSMSNAIYVYKTGKYFTTAGRAMGWVASLIGLLSVLSGAMIGLVLVPVAIFTQLTYNMVEFDLPGKTYRESLLLLGMKLGKKLPLPGFDFLFLNRNNYTRLSESRGSMTQFHMAKFDGYIKLSDGKKLHLLQEKSKAPAMQKLEAIANDLHTELRDLTELKY